MLCFCSASEKDGDELARLQSLAGPIPVIACSKSLMTDFVREAARKGVSHFISCGWDRASISGEISEAMRRGGITELLESCYPNALNDSPYAHKIVNAIVRGFPHRLNERELSRQLGMSERWVRTLCRDVFKNTFSQLVRRMWVHQALRMMEHTDLDNTEIALHLNYSEESSMARDFRKELGFGCAEARKRLLNSTPLELIKQAFLLVLKAVPTILLPLWYGNFPFGFDEVLNSAVSSFC